MQSLIRCEVVQHQGDCFGWIEGRRNRNELVFTKVDILGIPSDDQIRRYFSMRRRLRNGGTDCIDDADDGVDRHEGQLWCERAKAIARLHVRQTNTCSENLDTDFADRWIPQ